MLFSLAGGIAGDSRCNPPGLVWPEINDRKVWRGAVSNAGLLSKPVKYGLL